MAKVDIHQLGKMMQANGDVPLQKFTKKLGEVVTVGILMLGNDHEEFVSTIGFDVECGQSPLDEPTEEQLKAMSEFPEWKLALVVALARIGMAHYSTMVAKEHLKEVSNKN